MAKTSKDAYRHIRALSQFFSGVSAVGEAVVEEFLRNYEQKKYLKQSLRRLIKRGFVQKRNKKLILTALGRRLFGRFKIKPPRKREKWDGKWRIVSFDVPGNRNPQRDRLRSLLCEFNFRPLQKSVWISPYTVHDEFWKLVVDEGLDKHCRLMLVEILEGDQGLRRLFRLR